MNVLSKNKKRDSEIRSTFSLTDRSADRVQLGFQPQSDPMIQGVGSRQLLFLFFNNTFALHKG